MRIHLNPPRCVLDRTTGCGVLLTAAEQCLGHILVVDVCRRNYPQPTDIPFKVPHGCTLLSSPSPDKIRSQCPQGPRGRSYIIKYTEWGMGWAEALRFVLRSLDCLNIHSAGAADGRRCDKRMEWMGATRVEEGEEADGSTHICDDTLTEKLSQVRREGKEKKTNIPFKKRRQSHS